MPIHVYAGSSLDIYEDADEWNLLPSGVLTISNSEEDKIQAAYNIESWDKVLAVVDEDDESEDED